MMNHLTKHTMTNSKMDYKVSRIVIIILTILCCYLPGINISGYAEQGESSQDTEKRIRFVMGIDPNFNRDVDIKDATAATNLLMNELVNDYKYKVDFVLYESTELLIHDLIHEKVDFMNASSLDYYRIKERAAIELMFADMENSSDRYKYMILVNAESSIDNIDDAKNTKFIIKKGDDLGFLFLNTVLLRNNPNEAGNYFSEVKEARKHSQAILSVFFKSSDICVVTNSVYHNMIELNPQIGSQLKILEMSEVLINKVSFIRKNLSENVKNDLIKDSHLLLNMRRGKQILTLFKIESLSTIRESDLNSVKRLLDEYNQLKSNHKVAERD